MLGLKRISLVGFGTAVLLGITAPSFAASQDIPWIWNSGDHDAEARFESTGEHIYAKEYEGNDYVDYDPPGAGEQRWYIPGSEDGTQKDNNLSYGEDQEFLMQVCETKFAAPDDCSAWVGGRT